MNPEDSQRGKIVHALQERAKELNCLYRVGELLNQPDKSMEQILREIVPIIPGGWQYPGLCQARVVLEDMVIEPPQYQLSPWVLTANLMVQEEKIGSVQVSYREQMPRADEGPFLKEERRLIETIAERISSVVMQRRLKAAFENWNDTPGNSNDRHEWRIVVEFLRDTDPVLLKRIARKLINHLSWTGVPEAKELLQRGGTSNSAHPGIVVDENRPLRNEMQYLDLTKEAFRVAAQHLTESE